MILDFGENKMSFFVDDFELLAEMRLVSSRVSQIDIDMSGFMRSYPFFLRIFSHRMS